MDVDPKTGKDKKVLRNKFDRFLPAPGRLDQLRSGRFIQKRWRTQGKNARKAYENCWKTT